MLSTSSRIFFLRLNKPTLATSTSQNRRISLFITWITGQPKNNGTFCGLFHGYNIVVVTSSASYFFSSSKLVYEIGIKVAACICDNVSYKTYRYPEKVPFEGP